MNNPEQYTPGPVSGEVKKTAEAIWTLVLVRDLKHPPTRVWQALTDPALLHEWAPFDADRNMEKTGPVKLTTVGAPPPYNVAETSVKRAEPPKLLEYAWAGGEIRWELEPRGDGTRLTLWAQIQRGFVAMGAAGWHVCFDVMDRYLAGQPIGRITGPAAMSLPGFQRLNAEYSKLFDVEDISAKVAAQFAKQAGKEGSK